MTPGSHYRMGRFYKFEGIAIGEKPVAVTDKLNALQPISSITTSISLWRRILNRSVPSF
jgi:hypothetical protein